MLNDLLSNVGDYIHTNPWLALVAVFVGGVLTASNPCVLAMIPLCFTGRALLTGRTGTADWTSRTNQRRAFSTRVSGYTLIAYGTGSSN